MNSCIRAVTGLGLTWALSAAAWAQTPAPVTVTTPPKPTLTAEERAKRDADKVFHWIRMNADKAPAKPGAAASPKPAPKPAAVAAAATRPAAKAVIEAASEPAAPPSVVAVSDNSTVASREIEPPVQPASFAPRSEPAPAPEPAVAQAPEPEPELRLLHRVAPEFPRQLATTLTEGSVIVRFMVQPDGSVRNAEALKSSHRNLSTAALEAVNQWRFAPVSTPREATVEIGFSRGE